ncbi:LLM class flavin-dependent oxidoreductase [Candidatus Entotheonella palauensis]|uniref:LLM class flavin-dependent oxidoreductase n=1 Tax=Candidatus Entotheonella palauensis TaxID=93172 RepID=UPI000B7C8E8B|nr:LLM class flavin-dependent oxidoreductase [Candidatus Entotheonella palauensis]
MSDAPRFGVLVLPNQSWSNILAQAQQVERLGFDLFTMADHFVDWSDVSRPWLEGWSILTAVAMATSRIRLATYVTQIPLRHPAMLARQALTVDHISNGRLEIGLGTGIAIDPSYDMMCIPNWDGKERVARFKEYTQIVDLLLSNESSSFSGTYYGIQDAVVKPRPVQSPRPPIVIGALGPVMVRFSAQIADTWNTMSFAETFEKQLEDVAAKIDIANEACAKIGRDSGSLRRSYLMFDPIARSSGGSLSYYQSVGAFEDMAGRVMETGFSELCLYYPVVAEQISVFERIAQDILPNMRAEG